jgi:hypothetical protein
MKRTLLASLAIATLLGIGGAARADAPVRGAPARGTELSSAERDALHAGQTVSRPMRFSRGAEGRYVGGVSYQVVRASPREVLLALADVRGLAHALPHTLSAELVSSSGRSARVELVQGKEPFLVTYTLELAQQTGDDSIRFWLDRGRPHDLRDLFGFLRVREFGPGRSLVTVAVAVDLGPGIARLLFEDKVERSILRAPAKLRKFVEPRAVVTAR